MKKAIKLLFKYGCLGCYFILALVLILESCMPGNVSAGQSNQITETITDKTGIGGKTEFIRPQSIKIVTKQEVYNTNKPIKISCNITPSNASIKTIVYEIPSEYSDVVEFVSYGVIRFKKEGRACINVHIEGYETINDSIELEAEQKIIEPTALEIICVTNELIVTKSYQLGVLFTPIDTTEKTITWQTSDETIASINENGVLVCHKAGDIIVTAIASNAISITRKFTIKDDIEYPIEQLELHPTEGYDSATNTLTIVENTIIDLNKWLTILPETCNNKRVKWTINNDKIISVDSQGRLTALLGNAHSATLTVCAEDNESIKAEILVKVNSVESKFEVKNVNENNKILVNVNRNVTIELNKISKANQYEISYETKNDNVARIDKAGIIYGIKSGNTQGIIKCTNSDGKVKKITFDITVNIIPNPSFYTLIRKGIGHFGAFMVLAVIAAIVCILFFKHKLVTMLLSLVSGFIIAGITELIQLHVEGRTGAFSDVMIDFYGYLIGTIIVFGIYYFIQLIKKLSRKAKKKYE